MSFPGPDRYNLGGIAGAVVGAIGGIFALGSVPALIYQDPRLLFNTPLMNVISWILSLALGWKLGTLVGTRFGRKYATPRAEIIGGIAAGLFTVVLIALVGYVLWRQNPA